MTAKSTAELCRRSLPTREEAEGAPEWSHELPKFHFDPRSRERRFWGPSGGPLRAPLGFPFKASLKGALKGPSGRKPQ